MVKCVDQDREAEKCSYLDTKQNRNWCKTKSIDNTFTRKHKFDQFRSNEWQIKRFMNPTSG